MLASHGCAISLDSNDLSDGDQLVAALGALLEDPAYREHATRLARRLRLYPFSPRELLTRHVAFLAEHGALQRTLASTRLNFIQLYFLDALLLVVLLVGIAATAIALTLKRLTAYCRRDELKKND